MVGGGVDDGEGASTGGALEVFELVDGDFGSGGGFEHGGVVEHVCGVGGCGELSACRRWGREGERECCNEGEAWHRATKQREREHWYETHRFVICILAEAARWMGTERIMRRFRNRRKVMSL